MCSFCVGGDGSGRRRPARPGWHRPDHGDGQGDDGQRPTASRGRNANMATALRGVTTMATTGPRSGRPSGRRPPCDDQPEEQVDPAPGDVVELEQVLASRDQEPFVDDGHQTGEGLDTPTRILTIEANNRRPIAQTPTSPSQLSARYCGAGWSVTADPSFCVLLGWPGRCRPWRHRQGNPHPRPDEPASPETDEIDGIGPDGGQRRHLTLYIQAASPGADKVPNWLPCPAEGTWFLILRMYQPRDEVVQAIWRCPALRNVG
jgi:hypothetical protein